MTVRWTLICITMISIISQPFSLLAQQSNDWAAVKALGSGQDVRVEMKTGRKIDGSVSSISDERISVIVNGGSQDIAYSEVKKVYRV